MGAAEPRVDFLEDLITDVKRLLTAHFPQFHDVLSNTRVLTDQEYYDEFDKDDEIVREEMPLAWNFEKDVFVVLPEWLEDKSLEEIAYGFGYIVWVKVHNIKVEKDEHRRIKNAAANLRYEMDFNGHDAFCEEEPEFDENTVTDHTFFVNKLRNLIDFELAPTLSVQELYNHLLEKKDDQIFGDDDE